VNERRALGWLALGAVAAILWLARPFATGLFLGALMAFIVYPLYDRLARLTGRPTAVSVLTVLATATIIVGTVVEFGSLFLARAVVLAMNTPARSSTSSARWDVRPWPARW